jgi:dynein heavy chain
MEKRQRGQYGPLAGNLYVLFVDDLNMPAREEYFAQPPIELLRQVRRLWMLRQRVVCFFRRGVGDACDVVCACRQWCDYGGWYDRKERSFRRIIDTVLLSAMAPPGGGRNPITARLTRHYNVINCTRVDEDTEHRIFSTILRHFLTYGVVLLHDLCTSPALTCVVASYARVCSTTPGFEQSIVALCQQVVAATTSVYHIVSFELLPTPMKPHYTFNLRDLGKVFQVRCSPRAALCALG